MSQLKCTSALTMTYFEQVAGSIYSSIFIPPKKIIYTQVKYLYIQRCGACPPPPPQHIISSYNKQMGITADEAKVEFLKIICSWPTFGCTFFEVKVSHWRALSRTAKNSPRGNLERPGTCEC